MWIFLILLTLFQGLSTYLMCILIAQIINNDKSIIAIIKKISPYRLIEDYTPDKVFDNIILSILSRSLLFITGFTGILICIIIHDIYFKLSKSINNKETAEVLHEISNTNWEAVPESISTAVEQCDMLYYSSSTEECISYNNDNNYDSKINNDLNETYNTIDLLIDSRIVENGLDINNIINSIKKSNIICKRIGFIYKSSKVDKPKVQQLMDGLFYYININNIDDCIFILNKEYPQKDIEQTICICKEEDYNTSMFKHLCVSTNIDNLESEDYQNNISNNIIYKLMNS